MTEAEVTDQIIEHLTDRGWDCIRMNTGGRRKMRFGKKGMADWSCVKYPADQEAFERAWGVRDRCHWFFWLELKATGKTPDPDQVRWMDEKRALGATVVWFDDPEKFRKWHQETFE